MPKEQPIQAALWQGGEPGRATTRFVAATTSVGMRKGGPMLVLPHTSAAKGEERRFPALPTLLATRLQLELLLAERTIDLRVAAGILLNDVGATLEIFRRAGEERGSGLEMPMRIEDCLASLGTDAWMEAICAGAVERVAADEAALKGLTCFWEHARLLAYACWLVATQREGVCPEEAFLVGLLHTAARLPALLGWPGATVSSRGAKMPEPCTIETARALAAHWQLPRYLWPVVAGTTVPSRWRQVLEVAHAWSRGEDCLLTHTA